MKYLSDYANSKQTEAFNKFGAFFAFSDSQFNEKKVNGIKYTSLGAGLIAPTDNAKSLVKALNTITSEAIQADIADNGIKAIIHRELANHECQITGSYDDVIDKLEPYGITVEQIKAEWPEFWNICVDNDYF